MRHLALLLTMGLLGCDGKIGLGLDDTGSSSGSAAVIGTVSGDYAVGALATVGLDDWAVSDSLATISADPQVIAAGGDLVVLGRGTEDSVRVYAPGAWSAPRLEFALDDGANPHDAAVCGGALFVSEYGEPYVGVYDPDSGALLSTIDLSAYDDGDGKPEPGTMVQRGEDLYLALEQLDEETTHWTASGGTVLRIDCDARAVDDAWSVEPGPSIIADPDSEDGLLVRTGLYFDADGDFAWDGGLYALDTASGALTAIAPTESEAELNYTGMAAVAGGGAIVLSTDDSWAYSVWCLDRASGTLSLLDTVSTFLSAIEVNDRGEAWIAARASWAAPDAAGGLLVYDVATCTSKTGDAPITLHLEPYSIAFP